MYARSLKKPDYSFFLFGPRGTGKTTWLRDNFKGAFWKNLLLDSDYLPLLSDTGILSKEVEALEYGSWIVIDEVQ
jgi:predicted AAA+ superfamily ATPase